MAGKPSVLIDINILLDVLQKRLPFYESSAASWQPSRPGGCMDLLPPTA